MLPVKRWFTKAISSGLYVPGNQEKMLSKCIMANASIIVPDLEDSVPLDEKPKARDLVKKYLRTIRDAKGQQLTLTPRTNSVDSGLFEQDVVHLLDSQTASLIDGFCVTKVDTAPMATHICDFLSSQEKKLGIAQNSLKVIPQIESTAGLVDIKEILTAGRERFVAAAFGADDFTADFEVHRSDSDKEIDFARRYFALCCHARGVISIDTPYVKFKDTDGLKAELAYLKQIGMRAKFAIHPTQVDIINEAFMPSADELAMYKRMVVQFEEAQQSQGKAAINFEGKMVDIAAYKRALAIIKRS